MRVTLAVFILTALAAVVLYATVPTGFFPQQDTGFIQGVMITSQDASFAKTAEKIELVANVLRQDPPSPGSPSISARPASIRPASSCR